MPPNPATLSWSRPGPTVRASWSPRATSPSRAVRRIIDAEGFRPASGSDREDLAGRAGTDLPTAGRVHAQGPDDQARRLQRRLPGRGRRLPLDRHQVCRQPGVRAVPGLLTQRADRLQPRRGGDSAGGPSLDTGIYVGDDDQVTVQNNSVTNYVIGVVVENTIHATVQDNLLKGTRPASTWPSFPTTQAVHRRRRGRTQPGARNNLPNPVPPDSGDEIGGVPTGVGIVNLGSDHVGVRQQPGAGQRFAGRDRAAEPVCAGRSSHRARPRFQPGPRERRPPQRPASRSGPRHHPRRRHRL